MATPSLDKALAKLDAILTSIGNGPLTVKSGESTAPPVAAGVAPAAGKAAPPAGKAAPAAHKAPTAGPGQAAPEAKDILSSKVQLKVARILSAEKQPNSEKLLKCKVDLGENDVRQIMAGMQPYLTCEEMTGRLVVVVANLKPAKLAGEPSQGMILAAEAEMDSKLRVVPLAPPEGSLPGDVVHMDGHSPPQSVPKVLKLDDWKKVVPGLYIAAHGTAVFDGTALMTTHGLVTVPADIAAGSAIH